MALHLKFLKKLEYQRNQRGIVKRYLRETDTWAVHLENTKSFILDSANNKHKGTAMVLGSGWLLDIPLEALSAMFNKVYLIDIVHPPQIIQRIKKFENVWVENIDLLEVSSSAFHTAYQQGPSAGFISLLSQADFIISANLLTQLEIPLLKKNKKKSSKKNINDGLISQKIQQHHLDLLPAKKTCLITETMEYLYDRNDVLVREDRLMHADIPPSAFTKEWIWEFDTTFTYYDHYKRHLLVKAADI